MRIIAVSDLHKNLPEIGPCDLLLIGGDICSAIGDTAAMQQRWLNDSFQKWLSAVPARYKALTAGNHDIAFHKGLVHDLSASILIDEELTIEDEEKKRWRIWGAPWTRGEGHWAYECPEDDDLASKWNRIPAGVDILLTHAPPFGSGDGQSAGSVSLRNRILKLNPMLVVCGHIHGGYGEFKLGDTMVVNAALVDENYQMSKAPVVIDLWK
jgi:Icc-related predicted phosphoesterase